MSALETGAFERADFDSGWRNLHIFSPWDERIILELVDVLHGIKKK
jgi:septum formation inhibitor-activating ATPase MinD